MKKKEEKPAGQKSLVRTDRAYYLADGEVELTFGEQPAGEGQRGLKWFAFRGSGQLSPSQARPGTIRLHLEGHKAQELLRGLMGAWGVDWGGMSREALDRYAGQIAEVLSK
jgi:hypothetical protein